MADNTDETSTSRIQNIAAAQIARQTEICSANLASVKDKIQAINGDVSSIATSIMELRKEIASLMLDMAIKFSNLKFDVQRQLDSIQAQTVTLEQSCKAQTKALEQTSRQRWSIWPTLKDILIVLVSLASLAMTVYTLAK